jgi:hypothetical protein
MARCFKCGKPVFPFPTCGEHAEEWLAICEASKARVTKELEESEVQLAAQYHLTMPCREALVERWRSGELRNDPPLQRWLRAHLEYRLVCPEVA